MSAYIHTRDGITVFIRNVQYHVADTDPLFNVVVQLVSDRAADDVILEVINSMKKKVQDALIFNEYLRYENGTVYFKDRVLHNYAVDKLIQFIDEGLDPLPLANFLTRLGNNPSSSVVEHLYTFLEHGRIPITPNGKFLAYKAVRADYKDIYSGKFLNQIGCEPSMDRNRVDDRRYVTCSYGFHVCSFDYLPYFRHANGHVMICEIDPADVVAIPDDYNNTKMRVSRYKVVGEVQDYYKNNEHILAEAPIMSFGARYTVHGVYLDGEGESDPLFTTDDYKSACSYADDVFAEDEEMEIGWQSVLVRDGDTVVYAI